MRNTYTTPADFWQERDFGKKISATFEFIGAHWRPLGRVLLYLVAPAALLQSIVAAVMQSQLFGPLQQAALNQASGGGVFSAFSMYPSLFMSPLYWATNIVAVVFHSVLILSIYGYLLCCLQPGRPGPPTVPEVWAVVKSRLLNTFFSLYGVWLLIGVAFLVLALPGIYLGVVLSLFFVVSTLEGSGFGATISRCVALTKGKWWSTFGLILVMLLLIYMLVVSLGVVAAVFGGLRALVLSQGTFPAPVLVVITALSGLLSVLLYPPVMLALAFQYFNLAERKDGIGLRLLVDKLGTPAADVAATAPTLQPDYYRPDDEGEY